MKKNLIILAVALTALTGCGSGSGSSSSKESTPEDIARKFNELDTKYQSRINEFEKTYMMSFDPNEYVDREAAKAAFLEQFNKMYDEYKEEKGKIQLEYNELQNKYSTSNADLKKFNSQFSEARVYRKLPVYSLDSLPHTVVTCVNKVIPPYPDADVITRDLVGRKLAEGKEDGYYDSKWRWTVERGQVSEMRILEVCEQNDEKYTVEVSCVLSKGKDRLSMTANLKLYYVLPDDEGWRLDNMISNGLDFIPADENKEFIKMKNDRTHYVFKNISDVPLLVALTTYGKNGSTSKTSFLVQAQDSYDTYAYGCSIDYVLRP